MSIYGGYVIEGDIEGSPSKFTDELQGDEAQRDVGAVDPNRLPKLPSKPQSLTTSANPPGPAAVDRHSPYSGKHAAEIDGEPGGAGASSQTLSLAASGVRSGSVAAGLPGTPAATGQVVLVVDDDGSVRRSTNMLLRTLGYQVIEAERGAEAIAILQQTERIDIVLSDIVMPGGVSGIDLARWIEAEQPHRQLILMSGAVSPQQIPDLSIQVPLLRKPFRVEDLVRLIDRALKPS